jgi:hypothetical protein
MLKLANEYPTDFRISLFLAGYTAYDEQTGIYMRQSHGSPGFGNPTNYILGGLDRTGMREEQLAVWHEPPVAWAAHVERDDFPVIKAYTDKEAVRKANVWIARKIKGAGLDVKVIYFALDGETLTLTRGTRDGFEPFEPHDLEGFRDYLAANQIRYVTFAFYGSWPKRPVAVERTERHATRLYRYLPEWEREAAESQERERLRQIALASHERSRKAEPDIRATAPRQDAAVEVEHPRAPRLWSYLRVTGPREEVYAYVAHVFATDICTQCYEHMLYRLGGLDELADGRIVVNLSKSLYAGD